MTMHRRWIPPIFALAVTTVSSLPIWSGWFSDRAANLLSLGIAAFGFIFKAFLFGYMRRRMAAGNRRLTVFGRAIVDHWSAIVVFDVAIAGVFLTLFLLTLAAGKVPLWLVLANRSAINGGVALVIATGSAVAWEMHKIRENDALAVHEADAAP